MPAISTGGTLRAYELARPLAEQLGILLVPGVEITRPVPGQTSSWPVGSAHFNALFISDEEPLDAPDLATALGTARGQGGFVTWNHPQFMGRPAQWYQHVDELFERHLFSGIEVVNGDEYSPEAFAWALERRLTILACSDAHLPMPAHLRSARRPVTLLFARRRDLTAIREALVERRTAAWLDGDVWGEEEWLRAIWDGAVQASAAVSPRLARGSGFRPPTREHLGDRLRRGGRIRPGLAACVTGHAAPVCDGAAAWTGPRDCAGWSAADRARCARAQPARAAGRTTPRDAHAAPSSIMTGGMARPRALNVFSVGRGASVASARPRARTAAPVWT